MLQNRVDPWGVLNAVPDRGTLMGNRGTLHSPTNEVIRPWQRTAWVTCLLRYKNIQRPRPFSAGNYSELFFLDEATAFSAGHRPCTTCQRERSLQFKEAWVRANVGSAASKDSISLAEMDKIIHDERAIRGGGKKTFNAPIRNLPIGTFFAVGTSAFILGTESQYPWTFAGYGEAASFSPDLTVEVLTPASMVKTFAAGFVPHSMVTTGKHAAV